MNTASAKTDQRTEASDEAIRGVLFFLDQELKKRLDEVEKSDALIKIGDKTELTKHIEKVIKNPLHSMIQISNTLDMPIKSMVNSVINGFFKNNSDIIESVYKSNDQEHDLHYFIILKSDTDENRSILFDFLSYLSAINVTQKYPVYFQFVPIEYKPKIVHLQAVKYTA